MRSHNTRTIYSTALAGLLLLSVSVSARAQVATDSIATPQADSTAYVLPEGDVPVISYSAPQQKYIANIRIVGNKSYDEEVVRNVSGLRIGQRVTIPGDEITQAVRNYLRNGLFTDVRVDADRIVGDSVWLTISLSERPRLSELIINGVKKSESDDLKTGKLMALQQGTHITPNILDRSKIEIKRFFDEKGFSTASVTATSQEDPQRPGYVRVIFDVKKNTKTKVKHINFYGNEQVSDFKLRKAMKKTNERFDLSRHPWNSFLEIFSQKKFVEKEYKEDLKNVLSLYHQEGFRDAEILKDTIYVNDEKHINIDLHLHEGDRYYIKDIHFVGNTKYATDDLKRLLGIQPGDVYDQKKLQDRLQVDEDALSNLYSNNGYLFAYMIPVETEVKGDSVSLDIRISEGKPATINKVTIRGNDQLYEEVVRRELYTKPGMLFNRDYVMRSMRMIAQMGHFDQEKIVPNIVPNEQNGTVDIEWKLEPKSNDQVELSIGWSQTGLVGMAGLKFSNFSMRNLFNPKSYKGFLPRGDGQTLSLRAQTNARYYQSYSIQFTDPWFGRKRPNYFSVSAYYSRQTDINRRFYNSQLQNLPQYGYGGYGYPYGYGYGSPYGYGGYGSPYGYGGYGYGGYGYGGYGYGGYGGYGGYYGEQLSSIYESAYDPDKTLDIIGASIAYGKRLTWPDDNFQISASLNYQLYRMKNWSMIYYSFGMENGVANDINLNLTLTRSSVDNPIYTRRGSEFSISAKSTLPYSLFDKKDYSDPEMPDSERYKFIEYYQLSGKGQMFIPLMDPVNTQRTPVLMASVESGVIGSYNAHKRSPFGTYYMGGDGMSSYIGYLNQMVGLRGYKNGSIAGASGQGAYAYAKAFMELRYPVLFEGQTTIWLLGFLEAGNAWDQIRDYNTFQLKRSAGLGVRIMLPMVGLMGIDWGYGFDAPDGTNTIGGSNIHFVLGQQF